MRPATRRLAAALGVLVALTAASCGDDDSEPTPDASADVNYTRGLSGEERQVAATIEGYLEAFLDGDSDRICEYTKRGTDALERCRDSLGDFQPRPQPEYELRNVQIRGDLASAALVRVDGKGKPILIQLRRSEDGWQVLSASLPL